jgi:hypothetical protein
MSILNLNAPQGRAPRNNKATKVWLGVGLLVAVLGLGTTFAASIFLNGNQPTESGQGVQSIIFCGGISSTVTATPFSSYKNAYGTYNNGNSTNARFYFTGIKVSGIPKSCDNTDFLVSLYPTAASGDGPSSINPISVSDTMTVANVLWFDQNTSGLKYPKSAAPTNLATTCANNQSLSGYTSDVTTTGAILSLSRTSYISGCQYAYLSGIVADNGSSTGSFTITFAPSRTLADSSTLAKVVVETQNDVIGTNLKACSTYMSSYNCQGSPLGLSTAS